MREVGSGARATLPGQPENFLLILGLVAPDVLAGELERRGDLLLLDALLTRLADGSAEFKTRLLDLIPRSKIRGAGRYDGRHRFRHLHIMARGVAYDHDALSVRTTQLATLPRHMICGRIERDRHRETPNAPGMTRS